MTPTYSSWIHTSPTFSSAVKSADSHATGIFHFSRNALMINEVELSDKKSVKIVVKKLSKILQDIK
jgi:hypothetical protein